METKCPRHGLPSQPDPSCVAWVPRCQHLGSRFVVEIRSCNSDYWTIDYVEDRRGPDGVQVEVMVESLSAVDHAEFADAAFAAAVERMRVGDGPVARDGSLLPDDVMIAGYLGSHSMARTGEV